MLQQQIVKHQHQFNLKQIGQGKYLYCDCGAKKLHLEKVSEDILQGVKEDGSIYTVRKHRKLFFLPPLFKSLLKEMGESKAAWTAYVLIQTGARINEARYIEERDVDYDRNTIKLRIVKTKARKKGEERGTPRTIPISSKFAKELKKHFKSLPENSKIGLATTSSFNNTLKSTLKRMKITDYKMYSAHIIRKTHGTWLKVMGDARLMNISASEICLRLGHDYNTFLRDYGSSSTLNYSDLLIIKEILGDLYNFGVTGNI